MRKLIIFSFISLLFCGMVFAFEYEPSYGLSEWYKCDKKENSQFNDQMQYKCTKEMRSQYKPTMEQILLNDCVKLKSSSANSLTCPTGTIMTKQENVNTKVIGDVFYKQDGFVKVGYGNTGRTQTWTFTTCAPTRATCKKAVDSFLAEYDKKVAEKVALYAHFEKLTNEVDEKNQEIMNNFYEKRADYYNCLKSHPFKQFFNNFCGYEPSEPTKYSVKFENYSDSRKYYEWLKNR